MATTDDIQDQDVPDSLSANSPSLIDPLARVNLTLEKAKRAQALADVLRTQGMQPQASQIVGGRVVPMGWAQALAQLGAGVGAKAFQTKADDLTQGAVTQNQQALAAALQDYQSKQSTDPRGAALSAISSPFPSLQKAGQVDLAAINRKPTPLGTIDLATGDGNTWQTYQKNPDGTPNMNAPLGQPFSSKPGATKINTNVNMPGAEKKYGEKFGELTAQNDVALKESADKSVSTLRNVANVKQLLDSPVFTGSGADIKLQGSKILQALGAADTGDVNSNTELLRGLLGQNTLDAIKSSGLGSGQGFTDKDLQFLQDVQYGRTALTPQTLRRAADLQEKAALSTINRWNTRVSSIPKSALEGTGVGQIDLQPGDIASTLSMPQPAKAAPATPPGGAARPRSQAEYDSLPSGTTYLAPDGTTRRKK